MGSDKKRKMIWNIFPSFLIIIFISLTAVTFYATNYFKKIFLENSEKELTIRTKLLQGKVADMLAVDKEGNGHIDELCKDIGRRTGMRVTVVMPSGVAVGDSFADIASMPRLLSRPEIKAAMKGEKGVSVRQTLAVDKKMMHVALPLVSDEGLIAVLRTSISVSEIEQEIQAVKNQIFIVLFFMIMAAALASLFVTRRITLPIEKMKKGAAEFAKGNLDTRLEVPASEELSRLAVTMNLMAENLDEKIKEFQNRSRELEAVHASMQEGVIAIDRHERIITVNDAAARIFDFPSSNLKARYVLEVARNVEFHRFIERALATDDPVEDDIVITREADLILNIHSNVLYDNENHRMGTLIIFHDITRIRKLETLHKDFAANVSHELKTPLTTIKGFIETLQAEMEKGEIKNALNFLEIIKKNVSRMTDLINDLLALARLERLEGTGIQFENHSLCALIRGAVKTCSAGIEAKQITVDVDCPKDITVRVDPVLMEQAVFNLVDNAVKYSPEESTIRITAEQRNGVADIVVSDNGCGMGKEHLSKIFNRFYRVDKARSRQEGGTGLGLAIVKHVVQYHNGRVDVTSTKNRGTAFTIRIPI